jgi:hypothetical protein
MPTTSRAVRPFSTATPPVAVPTSPTSATIRVLRRHPRLPTQLRAILATDRGFQPTTIRDVSRGGVGLAGAIGLLPGDLVEVQLLTGQRYKGQLRWWCNGHCGVAFDTAISDQDPLLMLAERRRRATTPLRSLERP